MIDAVRKLPLLARAPGGRLGLKLNPRETRCIPVIKILALFDFAQK